MTVLVVDRDEAALKELPDGVHGVAADLAEDDWAGVEAALAGLPPLKAWVNNAGVVSHQHADDIDLAEFDRVMRINAAAVVRGAQVARSISTGRARSST
jgi:NAD(P)-dependent dehydrogenase (short-subunit alcohol dehydrogenase family)